MPDWIAPFTLWDIVAVGLLALCWGALGLVIERPVGPQSTAQIMNVYRRDWMRAFALRDNRIFDSQILGTLRQGTAFFASASLLAIGGGFALLGRPYCPRSSRWPRPSSNWC